MGFRLLFSICLFFSCSLWAQEGVNETDVLSQIEKEVLEYVEAEKGPVLSSRNSALYELILPYFQKLADAQAKISGRSGYVSVSQLKIINTPNEEAFVITDAKEGIRQLRATVYISTGLILSLLQGGQPVDLDRLNPEQLHRRFTDAIRSLIGVMTHELAHPLDKLDRKGTSIEIRRGAGGNSQPIEVKTDIEGELLSEKAGLGRGHLYFGLKRLFEHNRARTSHPFIAMVSSHPENSLRLSYLRIFHSAADQEFGEKLGEFRLSEKIPSLEKALQEVISLEPFKAHFGVTEPKSVEQALSKIRIIDRELNDYLAKVINSDPVGNREALMELMGFNRFLLAYQLNFNYLLKHLQSLTSFKEALPLRAQLFASELSFIGAISKVGTIEPWQANQIASRMGIDGIFRGTVESYNTKLTKRQIEKVVQEGYKLAKQNKNKIQSGENAVRAFSINALSAQIGFARAFAFYEDGFVKEWKSTAASIREKLTASQKLYDSRFYEYSLARNNRHFEIPSQALFYRNFVAKGEIGQWAAMLIVHNPGMRTFEDMTHNRFVPQLRRGFQSYLDAKTQRRTWLRSMELQGRNSAAARRQLKDYRVYMKHIWVNRGLFATVEFLSKTTSLDWQWIAEMAGEDPRRAQQLLKSEFLRFIVNTPEMNRFLKSLTKHLPAMEKVSMKAYFAEMGSALPEWVDKDLYLKMQSEQVTSMMKSNKLTTWVLTSVASSFVSEVKSTYMSRFREEMREIGPKVQIDYNFIRSFHYKILRTVFPTVNEVVERLNLFPEVLREVLETNSLTFTQKEQWLRHMALTLNSSTIRFLRGGMYWKKTGANSVAHENIRLIYRAGITLNEFQNPREFFTKLFHDGYLYHKYYQKLAEFKNQSKKGINKDEVFQEILKERVPINHTVGGSGIDDGARFSRENMHQAINALFKEIMADLDRALGSSDLDVKKTTVNEYSRLIGMDLNLEKGSFRDDFRKKRTSFFDFSPESNASSKRQKIGEEVFRLAEQVYSKQPSMLYKVWLHLTSHGGNPITDEFFRKYIMNLVGNENQVDRLTDLVRQERVQDPLLKVELAEIIIQSRVDRLEKEKFSSRSEFEEMRWLRQVSDVATLINEIADTDSPERDRLLEEVAVKIGARNQPLELLDSLKSLNWTKFSPELVKYVSAFNAYISSFSSKEKISLIRYMRTKKSEDLEVVRRALEKSKALVDGISFSDGERTKENKAFVDARTNAVDIIVTALQSFLDQSTHNMRLILIEAIINAGESPLFKSKDFYERMFYEKDLLGYEKGAIEPDFIRAFLEVSPEHARSVTFAYLLALKQVGEGESGIKEVVKVFRQIGIQFGQKASIWNVFSEEISRELADLKDNAGALNLKVIEDVVIKNLGWEMAQDLEFIKILGSASVKTVLLIRQKSTGKEFVMMVGNPYAKEQLESNLSKSQRLIEELTRMGISSESSLFRQIVDAMADVAYEEIDFRIEMIKTKHYQRVMEKLNKELGGKLNGWSLKVASPYLEEFWFKDLGFLEFAKGVPFSELPSGIKAEVGEAIVRSHLHMFFKHGIIESDRHDRNQFVDPKSRTINFFDAGKLEKLPRSWFKQDVRSHMAQLLFVMENADPKEIAESLRPLVMDGKNIGSKDFQGELGKLFNQSLDIKETLVEMVNIMSKYNINFRNEVLFSINTGLLTLFGEKYVSTERFLELLRLEVKEVLLKKPPLKLLAQRAFAKLKGKPVVPEPALTVEKLIAEPRTSSGIMCRDVYRIAN